MDYDYGDFGGYEPYEDDLKEWGDREAFEDMVADRESDRQAHGEGDEEYGDCRWCDYFGPLTNGLCPDCQKEAEDDYPEEVEDRYLDSSYEDRFEISSYGGEMDY